MILSHCPCLTWKFFIVWFHKILILIFHKEPLYPKNISAEHWRKLPNLTTLSEMFLYFQNDDFVEHVQIAMLNVLFTYFQSEIKISHRSGSFDFFFLFWFSSAIFFSKMKSLFLDLCTSPSVTNLSTNYDGKHKLQRWS